MILFTGLIQHFVKRYSEENGLKVKNVSEKAMIHFSQRDWPGNVREIENCVERAVVMCGPDVDTLDLHHFSLHEKMTPDEHFQPIGSSTTLRDAEKNLILSTLNSNENNRTKTAELLGISVRTLRNKLNEYRKEGIEI